MKTRLLAGEYLGEIASQVRIGDLVISELLYTSSSMPLRHSHQNAYLLWVLDGTQIEELGTERRLQRRGTLALRPADATHSHRVGIEGLRCLNVEIGREWLSHNPQGARVLHMPATFDAKDSRHMAFTARALYKEFRTLDDVGLLAIESCVLSLLAEIGRSGIPAKKRQPSWLQKTRDILHDSYSQPTSLRSLAAAAGVHPVHLAREFQRHFHCTVAEYIRRLRIAAACELIRSSCDSLGQIALQTGFADQAHFTRIFKRVTGMTPRQFRASLTVDKIASAVQDGAGVPS